MVDFHLSINTILEGLVLIGITWILRTLFTINGSIGQMKVWKESHEKQDDERYEALQKRHDTTEREHEAMWKAIHTKQPMKGAS